MFLLMVIFLLEKVIVSIIVVPRVIQNRLAQNGNMDVYIPLGHKIKLVISAQWLNVMEKNRSVKHLE